MNVAALQEALRERSRAYTAAFTWDAVAAAFENELAAAKAR